MRNAFVYLAILILPTSACIGQPAQLPVMDEAALEFDKVRISFSESGHYFLNLRTPEAVRREAAYTLVSTAPTYISRLYAGLRLSEARRCDTSLEEGRDVFLLVEFTSDEKREVWIGQGSKLFLDRSSRCVVLEKRGLESFDIAARLSQGEDR